MTYEPLIRLTVFIGMFLSLAFWEARKPRRQLHLNKVYRWLNNLSIVAIYSFLLRLMFPAAAVGFAVFAETHSLGLFYWLGLSGWVVLVLGVILLDFAIWAQHVGGCQHSCRVSPNTGFMALASHASCRPGF